MSIDTLGIRLYQHALAIRTHDVTVNTLKFVAFHLSHIKQYADFFTRAERILHNTAFIRTQLSIRITVRQSLDGSH